MKYVISAFCEFATGFILLVGLYPCSQFFKLFPNDTFFKFLNELNPTIFTGLLFCVYIIGILFHAIGLALGELGLEKLFDERSRGNSVSTIWENVSEHVLNYKNLQWDYYVFYRNLIIILPLGLLLWFPLLLKESKPILLTTIILATTVLWVSILKSCKAILGLYYDIGEPFRSSTDSDTLTDKSKTTKKCYKVTVEDTTD